MKKQTMICNEVAQELREQMATAIECGHDELSYEKEYGSALVIVEIYQRRVGGWLTTFTDVVVAHADARHQSPRLTEAISKALPDWDAMENDYRRKEARHEIPNYYQ